MLLWLMIIRMCIRVSAKFFKFGKDRTGSFVGCGFEFQVQAMVL
jgi:hypothetical protein